MYHLVLRVEIDWFLSASLGIYWILFRNGRVVMQRWPDKDASLVSASHISTDSDEISDVSDEEDIQYGEVY